MEKQAGLDGLLKTIKDFASNNKEMIIGGLAGSGLGAIGGYNMVDDYGLSEDEAYNARLRGGIIGGLTGLLGGGLAGHLIGTAGGAAAAGSGGENDKPKLENTPTTNSESMPAPTDNEARVSTEVDGPDEEAPKEQEPGSSGNAVGAMLDGSHEPAGGIAVTTAGGVVGAGAGVYAGGRLQGRYQAFNKQRTTNATNAANSAKLKATYARDDYRQAVRNTASPYVKAMKDDKFKVINPETGEVATLKELKQRHKIITAGARKKMNVYNKTVAETAAAYKKALAKQRKATAIARKAPRTAGRVGGGVLGLLAGLGMTLLGQNAVDYSQGE